MMNLILTAIVLVNLAILACIVYGFLRIHAIYTEFREFCTSPDDKTASGLATLVGNVSDILASRIGVQVKTTLMGMASGLSRGATADAAAELASSSPGMAGVMSLPGVGKKLAKNPLLAMLAQGLISKIGGMSGPTPQMAVPTQSGGSRGGFAASGGKF